VVSGGFVWLSPRGVLAQYPGGPFLGRLTADEIRRRDLLDVALGWRTTVRRLGEGEAMQQVLTEGVKIRRRELVRDSKSALEQSLTLEQYVAKREQTVDD
jgi:hypothetical protein